jgi:hypothetical protein
MNDTNTATSGSGRQVEKPENAGSNPAAPTSLLNFSPKIREILDDTFFWS